MAIFDEATEQRLLANDPTLTSLTLCSSDVAQLPNYSLRVGQALARSTHLTHLDFEVTLFDDDVERLESGDDVTNTAFNRAMAYVMYNPSLESLRLCSRGFDTCTQRTALAVSLLFRAINDRTTRGLYSVKSLSFDCLGLGVESMVNLFQNGRLQEFTFDACVIGPDGGENSIRQVARSFASCATITQLTLGVFIQNVALICALLEEDDLKGKIDTLALWNHGDENDGVLVATALSRFLRSSRGPLTMLSLRGFFWTDQSFAPIAETVSTAQTRINLGGGSVDVDACNLLRSMYLPDVKAKMLCLSLDMQFPDTNEYQTLIELVGSTPGLTSLALGMKDSNEAIHRHQLVAITSGLKSTPCAIRTLRLHGSASASLFEAFVNALPQFCSVEKLEMERLVPPDHWNGGLMEGFRKNRSLKEVSIEGMDASSRSRLDVYLQRNTELPSVIQKEALAFSSQCATSDQSDGAVVANSEDVASTTTSTTTTGKLLPPLFQASMDSAVPIGVSRLVGGLLCADENLGHRLSSKRTHGNSA